MKKIFRLTESDLVRIVKRVVNEQFGSPFNMFVSHILNLGLEYVMGDKNQNILEKTGYHNDAAYYIYVGKAGSRNWKYTKFIEEKLNSLRDLKNPAWRPVTSSKVLNDINKFAIRDNDTLYSILERNPTVFKIVDAIRRGKGTLNDSEALPEAAFMAIDSRQKYNEVKKELGKDPYEFVKSFMDTSKVYHKKSIDSSMKRLGLL
jgi:hypothetical protein